MTLSDHALGCDIEQIVGHDWQSLLGSDGLNHARMLKPPLDSAATQVWTLRESLRRRAQAWICKFKALPKSTGRCTRRRVRGGDLLSSG